MRTSLHNRWLGIAVVAGLTMGGAAAAAPAQAAPGCSVTYSVTSQWQGGFGADVKITNVGDAVNGWSLTWTFTTGQTITQLWNGSFTQSGTAVTVKDAGWNASLPTGGTASFGFNGSWTAANPVPASFALNGTTCTGTPSTGTTTTTSQPPSTTTQATTTTTVPATTTTTRTSTTPTSTSVTNPGSAGELVASSGKCLEAAGTAAGAATRITTCNGSAQQRWEYTGNREWRTNGTLCLDASGRGTVNGTSIIVWTCSGQDNQQWTWSGSTIVGAGSGRCVDVMNGSSADGTAVQLYDCHGGAAQQWTLRTSGSTTTTSSSTTTSTTTTSRPPTTTTTTTTSGNWPPSSTFSNPVSWLDFADLDVIRVGDVYYASASTMHYSPGAPVLRSYDLVNWEIAGHSVPSLAFDSSAYDLSGGRAYVKGIWASAFNYRPSNSTYYWIGCTEFNRTYVYTATDPAGTWSKRSRINNCYYDAGLLIDDNDTMYVAYGNGTLSVAQLSADGLSQVRTQQVFTLPAGFSGTLEGARFYKRNGAYYIWLTRPANGQYVLKSTNGPFGPYSMREVLLNLPGPISGGGVPHQGGLVQTQNGQWYYLAFIDAYPGGRVPALAPITWSGDGWPVLQTVNGTWGASYPYPNVPRPPRQVKPPTGTDTFTGSALAPEWEWNHNPDNSRYSVGNGLRLSTATVTNDLYNARNTLTRRILGPSSTATIELNYSTMADGDRAGLAMLRDTSAWIGVKREGSAYRLIMQNGLTMGTNWVTSSTGSEVASAAISGGRIWLRVNANIRPGSGRQAVFSYSTDGTNFTQFGTLTLNNNWTFFMGYRFGILNYATKALGGSVTVPRFTLSTP